MVKQINIKNSAAGNDWAPMHSSRFWAHSKLNANQDRKAPCDPRRKLLRSSPFWTADLDVNQHKADWAAGQKREAAHKIAQELLLHTQTSPEAFLDQADSESSTPSLPTPVFKPDPIRLPFDNRFETLSQSDPYQGWKTNRSAILHFPTIFSFHYTVNKSSIAPWPSAQEMKYEGDDRISTDKLHGRFLGAPRVEGNETVNWQHRAIISQEWLDDFLFPLPGEVEIWMRGHWVAELEFGDREGREILGEELWRCLDPEDQFLE